MQDLYLQLLRAGWAMSEVDRLDLPRWLGICRRAMTGERQNSETVYVDDVRW